MPDRPRWLSVHRHRVRGLAAPFVLILQHHIVDSVTRIAAPLVPAGSERASILAPHVMIDGVRFRAILLEMAAAPVRLLAPEAHDAAVDEDAVAAALDAIFRGYPVGLPGR